MSDTIEYLTSKLPQPGPDDLDVDKYLTGKFKELGLEKRQTIQDLIKQSDAPELEKTKMGISYFIADQLKIDPIDIYQNFDQYSQAYFGRIPDYRNDLQAVSDVFDANWKSQKISELRYQQMTGNKDPELGKQIQALKDSMPAPDRVARGLPAEVGKAFGAFIPSMVETTKGAIYGAGASAAVGALAAAAVGNLSPLAVIPEEALTVPASALAFAATGAKAGASLAMYRLEAGGAYGDMIDAGIPHDIAMPIAASVGAINAGIEFADLDILVDFIPGAKELMQKALKNSVMDVVSKGTLREGAAKIAKFAGNGMVKGAKFTAIETAQEVAQEGVAIFGQAFAENAAELAGNKVDRQTIDDITSRILETARSSALAFGVSGLAGGVANVAKDSAGTAIRGVADTKAMKEIDEELAASPEMNAELTRLAREAAENKTITIEQSANPDGSGTIMAIKDGNVKEPSAKLTYSVTDDGAIHVTEATGSREGIRAARKSLIGDSNEVTVIFDNPEFVELNVRPDQKLPSGRDFDLLNRARLAERIQAAAPQYEPEVIQTAIKMIEMRAKSAGVDPDEYVAQNFADVRGADAAQDMIGNLHQAGMLTQERGQAYNGFMQALDDGRKLIYLSKSANASTIFHETFHVFAKNIEGDTAGLFEKAYGKPIAQWKEAEHEQAAADFEKYLATGQAPNESAKTLFERLKDWFSQVYGSLEEFLGKGITPEARDAFDRMLMSKEDYEGRANGGTQANFDLPIYQENNLLAPNGKPSNLTPRQYAQVRTPEFKAWFGDWESDPENASKVLDENGEPLVVYHGTDAEFEVFDKNHAGENTNNESGYIEWSKTGLHFTSEKKYAEGQGVPRAVWLDIRNSLEITDGDLTRYIKEMESGEITGEQFAKDAKRHKYDGVMVNDVIDNGIRSNHYIVFSPNQIKSAIANNGGFSTENDSILFQERDTKLEKNAIEYFGETTDENEAGFILADGKMLDLSGEGILNYHRKGSRNLLHTEINRISGIDRTRDAIMDFLDRTGAVRCEFDSGTFHTIHPLTREQIKTIGDGAYGKDIEILYDTPEGRGGRFVQIKSANKTKVMQANAGGDILFQDSRSVEKIAYKFPPDLKGYSDIHSQAQLPPSISIFGRGVISKDGQDIRLGGIGASHVGLSNGLNDAKRFYFAYSRQDKTVYVVSKNGMDDSFIQNSKVMQAVLSEVFNKYRLGVAAGKKLQIQQASDTLFQENTILAPNGKPSNLNARQYAQVRTPEFIKWFGDWENDPESASKVLDENGEPLVVYRGGSKQREVLDPRYYGGNTDNPAAMLGFYFTDKKETARDYGNYIYEVFLSIKNPKSMERDTWEELGASSVEEVEIYRDNIERESHDGIMLGKEGDLEIIAFSSNQIKSAIANNGDFSTENDSILFQKELANLSEKNMAVFHNLDAGMIPKIMDIGGMPMPSLAITRKDLPFTQFGQSTLIGGRELFEEVYSRDIWSPTVPRPEFTKIKKKQDEFEAILWKGKKYIKHGFSLENLSDSEKKSPEDLERRLASHEGTWAAYLLDKGETLPEFTQLAGKDDFPFITADGYKQISEYLDSLPKPKIEKKPNPEYNPKGYTHAEQAEYLYEIYKRDGKLYTTNSDEKEAERALREAEREYTDAQQKEIGKIVWELYKEKNSIVEEFKMKPGEIQSIFWPDGTIRNNHLLYNAIDKNKSGMKDPDYEKREKYISKKIKEDSEGFEKWIHDKVYSMFSKPFIKVGKEKLAYLAGNILDWMKEQEAVGSQETMTGAPSLGKLATTSYEIMSDTDQIRTKGKELISDTALSELTDEISKLDGILREKLRKTYKWKDAIWEANDDVRKAMYTYMKQRRVKPSPEALAREFRKLDFRVDNDDQVIDEALDLIDRILKLPVDYFEAKPSRVVQLNEFKAIVIPEKTSEEIKAKIAETGLKTYEYKYVERGPKTRLAVVKQAISENPEVLFQKETPKIGLDAFDYAIKELGETDNIHEAGYVLPDGRMIDFSDKKNGGPTGDRVMDHRQIEYKNPPKERTDKMNKFIGWGAIRIDANSGLVDMAKYPTSEQWEIIRDIIESSGNIWFDMVDGKNRKASIEMEPDYQKAKGYTKRFYSGEDFEETIFFQLGEPEFTAAELEQAAREDDKEFYVFNQITNAGESEYIKQEAEKTGRTDEEITDDRMGYYRAIWDKAHETKPDQKKVYAPGELEAEAADFDNYEDWKKYYMEMQADADEAQADQAYLEAHPEEYELRARQHEQDAENTWNAIHPGKAQNRIKANQLFLEKMDKPLFAKILKAASEKGIKLPANLNSAMIRLRSVDWDPEGIVPNKDFPDDSKPAIHEGYWTMLQAGIKGGTSAFRNLALRSMGDVEGLKTWEQEIGIDLDPKDRTVAMLSLYSKELRDIMLDGQVTIKELSDEVKYGNQIIAHEKKSHEDQLKLIRIQTAMVKLAKIIRRPVGMSVDHKHREIIEELQSAIDPKFYRERKAKKLEKLRRFYEEHPDEMGELTQKELKRILAKPLNDWTLEELQTMYNVKKRLVKAGQLIENYRKTMIKMHRYCDKIDLLRASYNGEEPPERTDIGSAGEGKSLKERAKHIKNLLDTTLLHPDRLLDLLDHHADFKGTYHDIFYNRTVRTRQRVLANTNRKTEAALKQMKEFGLSIASFGKIETIEGKKYTHGQLLGISMMMKNEESRRAILYGNKVDQKVIDYAENQLSQAEYNYGEFMQDAYNVGFSRLSEAYSAMYNKRLPQVEYYTPLLRKDETHARIDQSTLNMLADRFHVGRGNVDKGMTASRIYIPDAYQMAAELDQVSVFFDQIERNEHFIETASQVADMKNYLNDREVRTAILKMSGKEYLKALRAYVDEIANPNIYAVTNTLEKGMRIVRGNMVKASLSFNILSMAKQVPGFILSVGETGPVHMLASLGKFMVNPAKVLNRAYELDPMIRGNSFSNDINDLKKIKNMNPAMKAIGKIGDIGMMPFSLLDRWTKAIVFDAAYSRFTANGLSLDRAALEAHNVVARTQPMGELMDLPGVSKGSEGGKWLTMYTTALNQMYNQFSYDLVYRKDQKLAFGATTLLAGTLTAIFMYAMGKGQLPEEPEELADAILDQSIAMIPIIGGAINAGRTGWASSSSPVETPNKVAQILASDKTTEEKAGKLSMELIDMLGLPGVEIRRIAILAETGDAKDILGKNWGDD